MTIFQLRWDRCICSICLLLYRLFYLSACSCSGLCNDRKYSSIPKPACARTMLPSFVTIAFGWRRASMSAARRCRSGYRSLCASSWIGACFEMGNSLREGCREGVSALTLTADQNLVVWVSVRDRRNISYTSNNSLEPKDKEWRCKREDEACMQKHRAEPEPRTTWREPRPPNGHSRNSQHKPALGKIITGSIC